MTKDKIKEVACREFARKGFKGTTLSSIAKEVGIKTPSIYAFFKNKEDLFLQVYEDLLNDHYSNVLTKVENMSSSNAQDKLYGIIQTILSFHRSNPEKTELLTRLTLFPPEFLSENISESFLDNDESLHKLLYPIFEDGIRNGELKEQPTEDLVTSFICLLDGVYLELLYYPEEQFLPRMERIWRVYWNGIKK